MLDGVSAIALILIASFGIDRIVTGVLFLLGFLKPWRRLVPDPSLLGDERQRAEAERKRKLVYFALAGVLGVGVLAYFGEVRIFAALGFVQTNAILDAIMTGLILVAGADRVAALLQLSGAGGAGSGSTGSAPQPIEITGRLILEGDKVKVARAE